AMADHAAFGRKGFVIERHVEKALRPVGAQRAADLYRAYRPPRKGPAAAVIDQLAQRDAKGALDQSTALDVAGELDRHRAARAPHAVVSVVVRTLGKDDRHARERDEVVDHGRLREQAGDGRERWLGTYLSALAFEALQQRRLLAADISARAEPRLHVEDLLA